MHLRKIVVSLVGLFTAAVALASAEGDGRLARDEMLLERAGCGSSGAALLDFFRKRTPGEATQRHIERLLEQLDGNTFADRQQASRKLVEWGPCALPALRRATVGQSLELTRRADHCIRMIEETMLAGVPAAAARGLQRRGPAGACAVLLAYLPYAEDEATQDVVAAVLGELGVRDGKVDPALMAAAGDPLPVRRMAAAAALARAGGVDERRQARALLDDPQPRVRLFAAQALLYAGDKSAVAGLFPLIAEGSLDYARQADNLLCRVAGRRVPDIDIADPGILSRGKCRDAWATWWQANEGKVDLGMLRRDDDFGPELAWFVERLTAAIRDRLENKNLGRRGLDRARLLAVALAGAAQDAAPGPLSPSRATLRDAALALAAAFKEGNVAAARKQLAVLPYLHADQRSRPARLALLKDDLDVDEVMSIFGNPRSGSLGTERKMDTLLEASRKTETVAAFELNDDLQLHVRVVAAVVAMIREEHKPPKKLAEWKTRAQQAHQAALAAAEAVGSKDGKQSYRALLRLQNACNACHDIFRQ